jgi:hypothetical protein
VHINHGTSASSKGQGSPNIPQPVLLPGYRDALFGTMQQTLAWRDSARDSEGGPAQQLPRLSSMGDSRSGQLLDSRDFQAASQNGNFRGIGQNKIQCRGFTPPLLSESMSDTTKSGSSTGTNQSPYYGPRTPMEVTLERSLPIPQTYSAKSYENQLPPLRPSMSPRASINTPYNSSPSISH